MDTRSAGQRPGWQVGSGGLPEVPEVCQGRDEVGGPSPEPAGSEARPGRPLDF